MNTRDAPLSYPSSTLDSKPPAPRPLPFRVRLPLEWGPRAPALVPAPSPESQRSDGRAAEKDPGQKPGGGSEPGITEPASRLLPARAERPGALTRPRRPPPGSRHAVPRVGTGARWTPRGDQRSLCTPRSPQRAPLVLSSLRQRRALGADPRDPRRRPAALSSLGSRTAARGPLGIVVPAPTAGAPSAPSGAAARTTVPGVQCGVAPAARRPPEVAGAQTAGGAAGRGASRGDAARNLPAHRGVAEGAAPRAPGPRRERPEGRRLLHRP